MGPDHPTYIPDTIGPACIMSCVVNNIYPTDATGDLTPCLVAVTVPVKFASLEQIEKKLLDKRSRVGLEWPVDKV